MMRDILAEWVEFDGPVMGDVLTMVYRRHMYRRFMEICRLAPSEVMESGAEYQRWVLAMYGEVQLMALRRQADRGSEGKGNVQSLARLIELLIEADDDGSDLEQMKDHRRELRTATRRASDRATTTIAHLLDRETWSESAIESERITFAEIHEAIDTMVRIINYYERVLLETTTVFEPFLTTPWEHAFTMRWVSEDVLWRSVRENE